MRKKSKPASLTSSLLARKGKAEAASVPLGVPGGVHAGAQTSGNGNGGGNGHGASALGGLPLPELSETALRGAELENASTAHAGAPAGPVLRAAAPSDPQESGGQDAERFEVEQESRRDARLLRFVYGMAALTGILAIIIYAGGWYIDGVPQNTARQGVPWTKSDRLAQPTGGTDRVWLDRPVASAKPSAVRSGGVAIPAAPPISTEPPQSQAEPQEPSIAPDLPIGGKAMQGGMTDRVEAPADTTGAVVRGTLLPVVPAPPADAMQQATATDGKDADNAANAAPSRIVAEAKAGASADAASSAAPAPASADVGKAEAPANPVVAAATTEKTVAEAGRAPSDTETDAGRAKGAAQLASVTPDASGQSSAAKPAIVEKPAAAETTAGAAAVAAVSTARVIATKPSGRFLVQLSSVRSETRADREWRRLKKVFPNILGKRDLIIEKRKIASRGVFYRVQTGHFETAAEARAVCTLLKARKQGCLPIKR